MKRTLKRGLRKAVVLPLVSGCVDAYAAGQRACLPLDKPVCRSGEVMFDTGRFDDRTALERQSPRSSAFDPVVKLVSMLP